MSCSQHHFSACLLMLLSWVFATQPCFPQFPGNIIPANLVSHAGAAVLQQLFPAPNLPGTNYGYTNNYAVSDPVSGHQQWIDLKLDRSLSDKNRISGIYHIQRYTYTIAAP